jgi:hypothetical protein
MKPRTGLSQIRWIVSSALASFISAGCGVVGPRPASPNDFYSTQYPEVRPANDQGGFIVYSGGQVAAAQAPQTPPEHRDDTISPTVQRASTQPVTTPDPGDARADAALAAATQPAGAAGAGNAASSAWPTTAPQGEAAIGSGQYMVMGGVVATVDNTPIYANKVVAYLTPILRNIARDPDETPEKFREYVITGGPSASEGYIQQEVDAEIHNQLLYTAAMHNLNDEQKNRARGLTTEWYERQITDAGGSVELANQRAMAEGKTLDEKTRDTYLDYVNKIYMQYTIFPRIDVTAQNMRDYYEEHKKRDFTLFDHAAFYLIEINPANEPGDTTQARAINALDKIRNVRAQVVAGQSFRERAGAVNDDARLMEYAKDSKPLSFDRGAFSIDEVDKAVFSLQPGQMSDIISAGGNYYLAELESRTVGRVLPFDDPDVQSRIELALKGQQFSALQQAQIDKLMSEAAVVKFPEMYEATLQMIMQNYPAWHGK